MAITERSRNSVLVLALEPRKTARDVSRGAIGDRLYFQMLPHVVGPRRRQPGYGVATNECQLGHVKFTCDDRRADAASYLEQ